MQIIRQSCVKGIVFCIVRLPKVENFQIIWKQGEVWITREETEYIEKTLFPHNKEIFNPWKPYNTESYHLRPI